MPLVLNMVINSVLDDAIIKGLHRLLFFSPDLPDAVVLPMSAQNGTWFRCVPRDVLSRQLDQEHKLAQATYKLPSIQLLTDTEIARRFPPRNGQAISAPIRVRDARRALVAPLITLEDGRPRPLVQVFAKGYISRWIAETSAARNRNLRSQIYHHLRVYWINGGTWNALLPDYAECGKITDGKVRNVTKKLGRPNGLVLEGELDKAGFIVDAEENLRIEAFWAGKSSKEGSVHDWFLEYSTVFHHESIEIRGNEQIVCLKPAHLRPTEDQFKSRGPKSGPRQAAFFKRLSDLEYEQQYAPRFGSSTDGIAAVGQYGSMDLTGLKLQLVSIDNPLKRAGVGSRIPLIELLTGFPLSTHCFYGQHSVQDALLALYIAGTTKSWIGKKLGVDWINDANFPAMLPATILVDHDELFTQEARLAAKEAGITIEFPAPLHAEQKPDVESDHHRAHQATAHKMSGSTHGRPKKRDEPDPRDFARWNLLDFMRVEWRHRYLQAHVVQVPHLVTTEMRRDNVHLNPTRANILRWLCENTPVGYKATDPDKLTTFLLPRIRVKIFRDGIRLLRPNRGGAEEFVPGVRYVSPYLVEAGWVGRLPKSGTPLLAPYMPYDPTQLWIVDPDHGVQPMHLVCDDPLIGKELTIPDLIARRDGDRVISLRNRQHVDEETANFVMNRKLGDASAGKVQEQLSESEDQKLTKKELRRDIKETQAAERDKLSVEFRPDDLSPAPPEPKPDSGEASTDKSRSVGSPFAKRMQRVIARQTSKQDGV